MAGPRSPARARTSTACHVALLRGINVGGKNKLPMAALRTLFEELGCTGVRTYIQSGNVVFGASARLAGTLAAALSARIRARHGLEVPVLLRSAAELARTLARNPFLRAGEPVESLHVAFLAAVPAKRAAASLDPERSPGDRFALVGRDLYLCLPNGVGRTKLTNAWLDRGLETTSTVRNWRTVTTLAEMAREGD